MISSSVFWKDLSHKYAVHCQYEAKKATLLIPKGSHMTALIERIFINRAVAQKSENTATFCQHYGSQISYS